MVEPGKRATVTDEHREEARRLREIWDRVKPTSQAVFGKEFGIGGQTAVSNFLLGLSALSMKAAIGFRNGLGCEIADFSPRLAAQAAQVVEATAIQPTLDGFVPVRRADVKFSNGTGRVVYTVEDKPPLVFRADFLHRMGISPRNAVVVEATGVSNQPKIMDGAVVLVDKGDTERLDGRFFAFRVDGELLIKRLQRMDGVGVLAIAENSDFNPKTVVYNGLIDMEIIGHAVWTGVVL